MIITEELVQQVDGLGIDRSLEAAAEGVADIEV